METKRRPIIFCQDPETNTWHSPFGAWTIRFRRDTPVLELVGPHAQVPTYLASEGRVNDALELAQTLIWAHHDRLARRPHPRPTDGGHSPVDVLVRGNGGGHRRMGDKLLPTVGR